MSLFNKKLFYLVLTLSNIPLYSKFPLCISLGSACGPALNLRSLGLRQEAYPFDWTVSPFDALIQALEDDFKHFLDDIQMRPDKTGVIDYYGIHFTHDWPTVHQPTIDALTEDIVGSCVLYPEWENAIPLVKEKYRRRIERFKTACLGKEKVFFIRSVEITKDQAIRLKNFFKIQFPTLHFVLIVVSADHNDAVAWNIENIQNYYVDKKQWDDYVTYGEILKQIDPAFNNLKIVKKLQKTAYSLYCPYCLHTNNE